MIGTDVRQPVIVQRMEWELHETFLCFLGGDSNGGMSVSARVW